MKKSNYKNSKYRFIVFYNLATQYTFEGKAIQVEVPVGDVHIVSGNFIICRESVDSIFKKLGVKVSRFHHNRPAGRMCKNCQEEWKTRSDSAWKKWTDGVAKSGGKTPEMAKLGG